VTTAPEEIVDMLAVDRALRNNTPLTDLELPEQRYAARLLTEDGETASAIAKRFGVTSRTIVRWRGQTPTVSRPAEPKQTDDWTERALCREVDAALFFPPDDADDIGNNNTVFYNEARAVCIRCPVRDLCLEAAMAREGNVSHHLRAGMWGGLSPNQRAALAKARSTEVPA